MKSSVNFTVGVLSLAPLALAASISSLSLPTREILRRAENSSTTPAAISVAPSQYWDGDDGPWSSFPLQVGHAAQNVRAMIGTSAPAVITVSPSGCPSSLSANCPNDRGGLFNPNQSLTWVPNSLYEIGIDIDLGLDTTAPTGFDTVTLGWQGSGGPSVQHTVVYNTPVSIYWVGVFGLSPYPTNFSDFVDPQPSFMQQLVNNKTIPSLSYGYTAGNQYRLDKVFGSLTLGGYDENRFNTNENVSVPFHADISKDLLVNVQKITTDSGTPSNLLPGGSIAMFIDSTVAQIWLPQSACSAFEQAFGLTYDEYSEFYLVNSSLHDSLKASNPNVTFTLGSEVSGGPTVEIVLPYGAFDLQVNYPNVVNPNSSYYFPLKRAANDTQYTLGRAFLQEAYIIADYDRQNFTVAPCIWDSSKVGTTNIKSILRANDTQSDDGSSSSTGSHAGAIAGGVVGGVVGLVAITAGILFFLRRRKQNQKKHLSELDGKNGRDRGAQEQSSMDSNEDKPFISQPLGGELASGEIHELTAPQKRYAQELDSPYKMDPNKHGYSEMAGGDHFGPSGKGGTSEAQSTPVYEMPGSDVHEMPAREQHPEPDSAAS